MFDDSSLKMSAPIWKPRKCILTFIFVSAFIQNSQCIHTFTEKDINTYRYDIYKIHFNYKSCSENILQ